MVPSVNVTTAGTSPEPGSAIRILVAIVSYGTGNDYYLRQLISTYRGMPFTVDIVILSNIKKEFGDDIQCLVGLPSKNPWSLPFAHKRVFVENIDNYDLFLYSEDDILVTEKNIIAFLSVSEKLQADEVAGFIRVEKDADGRVNYPDWQGYFHWDCSSVRSCDEYVVAHFTNEHAACYLLTQSQLRAAIKSGGFAVAPHEGKYDMLCAAATDPYTQCGMKKVVPVSHIDDFIVHHMSNKYINVIGIGPVEFRRQIDTLLLINKDRSRSGSLFCTETKLPRGLYSKGYYEQVKTEILLAVPQSAKRVLSIGYCSGRNELALSERGAEVTAIPLDAICAENASANGLRVVEGSLDVVRAKLGSENFDCILYLNVLHLAEDPGREMSLFRAICGRDAVIVVQSPNMRSAQAMRQSFRDDRFFGSSKFSETRVHRTSVRVVRGWCRTAGYEIEQVVGIDSRPIYGYRGSAGSFTDLLMASEFVATARPAENRFR